MEPKPRRGKTTSGTCKPEPAWVHDGNASENRADLCPYLALTLTPDLCSSRHGITYSIWPSNAVNNPVGRNLRVPEDRLTRRLE